MPGGGFPHSDIAGSSRVDTPDQRFSQCPTSFIGSLWLGIHHTPFLPFFPVATEKLVLQRVTLWFVLVCSLCTW